MRLVPHYRSICTIMKRTPALILASFLTFVFTSGSRGPGLPTSTDRPKEVVPVTQQQVWHPAVYPGDQGKTAVPVAPEYFAELHDCGHPKKRGEEFCLTCARAQQVQRTAYENSLRQGAAAIDTMAIKVEEFGTVTLSAPLLATPEKPPGKSEAPFAFGLNYSADKYYQLNQNTVNASVGNAERIVNSLSLKGSLTNNSVTRDIYESQVEAHEIERANYREARLRYEEGLVEKEKLYELQKKNLEEQRDTQLALIEADKDMTAQAKAAKRAEVQAQYANSLQQLTQARYGNSGTGQIPIFSPTVGTGTPPTDDDEEEEGEPAEGEGDGSGGEAASTTTTTTTTTTPGTTAEEPETGANPPTPPVFGSNQDQFDFSTALKEPVPGENIPDAARARQVLTEIAKWSALDAVKTNPSLSPRTNMVNAYGDKMVQSIFNFLGDPSGAIPFKDKITMFGVATVSVSPGWRTQRDFAADVTVKTGYSGYAPARIETVRRLLGDNRFPTNLRAAIAQTYGLAFGSEVEAARALTHATSEKLTQERRTQHAVLQSDTALNLQRTQENKVRTAEIQVREAELDLEEVTAAEEALEKAKTEYNEAKANLDRLKKAAPQAAGPDRGNADTSPPAETGAPATRQTPSAAAGSGTGGGQPNAAEQIRHAEELLAAKKAAFKQATAHHKAAQEKQNQRVQAALQRLNEELAKLVTASDAQTKALEVRSREESRLEELQEALNEAEVLRAALRSPAGSIDHQLMYASAPAWLKANLDPNIEPNSPVVAGVSPLMETQTLDLESQWRRQDEFALSLAALMQEAGLKAETGAFYQFVKNRQSDARSRTSSAAVSSYSAGGGLFGFQIGPRLQALADPASKKAGQGRVLERQTIPVLIIFGADHDDIMPRLNLDNGKLQVVERSMTLEQTTRWTHMLPPLHQRFHLFKPSTWEWQVRWSEKERVESLILNNRAKKQLTPYLKASPPDLTTESLVQRAVHLSYLSLGASTTIAPPCELMLAEEFQSLEVVPRRPPPAVPSQRAVTVQKVFPASVAYDVKDVQDGKTLEMEFMISGSHLDLVDPAFSQGQVQAGKLQQIIETSAPGLVEVTGLKVADGYRIIVQTKILAEVAGGFSFRLPVQSSMTALTGQQHVYTPLISLKPLSVAAE